MWEETSDCHDSAMFWLRMIHGKVEMVCDCFGAESSFFSVCFAYSMKIYAYYYAPINVMPAGGGGEAGHRVGI